MSKDRWVVPTFQFSEEGSDPGSETLSAVEAVARRLRFDRRTLPIEGIHLVARLQCLELTVQLAALERNEGFPIGVMRRVALPWEPIRANGADQVVRWIRETIANLLSHEVDEAISLDGERVFDPHRALGT